MDAPQDYESLKQRLIEIEPSLPKRLRQTAAFVLDHPDEVALGAASRVAERAEVQASTLVRFAQALGFAGFSDLQAIFRAHLRNRWPDYSERLEALHQGALASGDPLQLLLGFADSAAASLAQLRRNLRREELEAALAPLVRARLIYVVGQRRSFSVAHYLVYALAQLGVGAALIDDVGGLGREQLAAAGPDDALIAVSFAPYAPFTIERVKARARRRNADRRRHRQRAEPAFGPRRRAARSGRERLRLVPLASGDVLPGDDARGRRGRAAARSDGLSRSIPPPARAGAARRADR